MTTKAFEPRKIEDFDYEFVFYINNHIICQRFFDIRNFNEDVIQSYSIKELMDSICGMNNGKYGELGIIPNFLKNKSVDYLWENYNPYDDQPVQDVRSNDKIDNFQFEIKYKKVSIGKSIFSGNVFPTKVRYAVDIKPIIPLIFSEIRTFMGQEKYEIIGS